MKSTKSGVFVDEASLKRVLGKLEKLPSGMRRNAMASATMAGAKVVVKIAKRKAPSCIAGSIKAKRSKQRVDSHGNKSVVVRVSAGNPRNALGSAVSSLNSIMKKAGQQGLSKSQKRHMDTMACLPAIWYEMGTYNARNLMMNPYAPKTASRMRNYASGARTSYNQHGGRSPMIEWTKGDVPTIQPMHFMRNAIREGEKSQQVQRAMGKKLEAYLKKQGV